MSACALLYRPVTANDQFKLRYPGYLRRSAVVAILLMALLFMLSPRYVPNPYRLPPPDILELLPVPEYEIPVPPPPLQRLPVNIEPAPDLEVIDQLRIEDTLIDLARALTRPVGPRVPVITETFVPSAADPELIRYAEPDYPELARLAHLEGTVVVKVLVGPEGSVLAAEVINGVHPLLNRAALAAARKCRFSPGMQRELPVKAWMAIPYRFRLH